MAASDKKLDPSKSLLVWVVEVFAIVTTAALTASAIVNTIIFARWGLSFPQLASSADILISGVALVAASLAFAAPVLIIWRGFLFYIEDVDITLPVWPIVQSVVNILAGAIVITLAVTAFYLSIRYATGQNISLWIVLLIFSVASFGIIIFAVTFGYWLQKQNASMLPLGFSYLIVSMAICDFLFLSTYGYQLRPIFVVEPNLPECGSGELLWAGEYSLVVRCSNETIRVVRNPENGVLSLRVRP